MVSWGFICQKWEWQVQCNMNRDWWSFSSWRALALLLQVDLWRRSRERRGSRVASVGFSCLIARSYRLKLQLHPNNLAYYWIIATASTAFMPGRQGKATWWWINFCFCWFVHKISVTSWTDEIFRIFWHQANISTYVFPHISHRSFRNDTLVVSTKLSSSCKFIVLNQSGSFY